MTINPKEGMMIWGRTAAFRLRQQRFWEYPGDPLLPRKIKKSRQTYVVPHPHRSSNDFSHARHQQINLGKENSFRWVSAERSTGTTHHIGTVAAMDPFPLRMLTAWLHHRVVLLFSLTKQNWCLIQWSFVALTDSVTRLSSGHLNM